MREHQPLDLALAGLPGNIERRHVSPGAGTKRIGRFQPVATFAIEASRVR